MRRASHALSPVTHSRTQRAQAMRSDAQMRCAARVVRAFISAAAYREKWHGQATATAQKVARTRHTRAICACSARYRSQRSARCMQDSSAEELTEDLRSVARALNASLGTEHRRARPCLIGSVQTPTLAMCNSTLWSGGGWHAAPQPSATSGHYSTFH